MDIDGIKWKIRYDETEKNYIVYRIMNKAEMQNHLANADKQLVNLQLVKDNWQTYIDDERIVDETNDK